MPKNIRHKIQVSPRTAPDEHRYSSPEIAKYVQALIFEAQPYWQEAEENSFIHILSPETTSIVGRLKSITYLKLRKCRFSSITPEDRNAMAIAFPLLRTLAIASCHFRSLDDVLSLMSAFPTLRCLEVSGIAISNDGSSQALASPGTTSVTTPGPRLSKLTFVNLSADGQSDMCQWLAVAAQNFVEGFQLEMIFCEENEGVLKGASDVLRTLGSTVKRLDLGYESDCDDTCEWHPAKLVVGLRLMCIIAWADISSSTALQTLTLRHSFNSYDEPYGQVNWVAATLATVSSPLQKLTIEVIKGGDDEAFDDRHVDIGPIDDALNAPAYKHLKQLVFWFSDSMEPDARRGTEQFLLEGLARSTVHMPMPILYRDYFEAKSPFRYSL